MMKLLQKLESHKWLSNLKSLTILNSKFNKMTCMNCDMTMD